MTALDFDAKFVLVAVHGRHARVLAHVEAGGAHGAQPAREQLLFVRLADEQRQALLAVRVRVEHELSARKPANALRDRGLLEHDHTKTELLRF
jgi:hypothetical protein